MGSRGRASDVKGEEEELLPPLTFASSILREPFVQDIIIENEMMLGEVTRLRLLRERYMEESRQHVNTAETAGRQLLAAREAERRVELCVWWQTFILSGLRDALEELETAQEEIAALQKVMLSVQEELGAVEQHSPLVSSEGELTPARVITAADLGSKLHANYTRLSNYGGGSYSPRVSLGHTRKRRRSSGGGDGWLLTLSETPGEEQSKALLQYSSDGQLRAVSSRKYPATTAENSTVLSGFLTRLYDTKSVSENKGRMTPLQLLAYHKQAKQRTTPLTRFFDGIINLDEEAVQVAVEQSSVDEMLLLLFNDWDHDADAFIAALQTLSTEMEVYKSGLKNDNVPAGLNEALKKEKLDSSHLAFIRPDAFRRALYPDDDVKEEGKYQSGKRKLFFLWPRSQSGGSRLLQVIAAIRKAEFERSAFPRPEIFSLAFQSSALFFCSKGISNIVRYTGLPTVKGIANFVTRHTLSYLQLGSASELRLVLARFDRLVLIVCKKGGEQAAATVASSTTPLKDILLNNTLDMRFRLRSALPTFFLQEDQFTGDPNVINWNALKVISSRRLEPESLQFFASLYKGQLPADFVQQLHLLPTSNDVRLVLLSRRQLSPEGKRTGTLADFSSHVLCFPAPSSKTDYRVWSDTVGARLIDFVESPEVTWPSIKEVTGKTLQGVYEQHFRVSVRESSLRMRQQPFLAMSNKSDFKTSEPNKYKPELLVLVVLPPANARGNNDCESSVFHAAHAGSPNDGIQFATTTADDSFALVEELRFIVWGQFSRMPAKFCEVYVFHPDGKVNAMDIQPTELRSPNGGWLALFLRVPNEERKAGLTISHPPVEDYLSALKEIRQEMKKLNSSSVNNVFRSSFYGTADGFAPWFLWLPSREMVPYLIYVQNQTQQQPERDSGKTLKGNSETAVSQDTAILLLHDTSCGTAANHLKAFRLLAKCQKMNLLPALPDMIEYDLSDTYLIPEHNGQRLRSSITNVHEARYSEVYSRLAPFLQNFRQLQPPRLLAMNPTHVITTTSTSRSYDYATGMEKTDVYNGFVRSLVRLVSHVDTRLTPSSLCKCVQEAMFDDAKRRNRYRPSKSKKP